MQQCRAYIKTGLFKRCKRRQKGPFCHLHLAEAPRPLRGFWRVHMTLAGLVPPKIDPRRPWAILLDGEGKAIQGFPLGKGLSGARLETWGRCARTAWVFEEDLHEYF